MTKNYKLIEREHYNSRFKKTFMGSYPEISPLDSVNAIATNSFYDKVNCYKQKLKQGKILDYGCGTGGKSQFLADDNWFVCGIDISDKSIELGRKLYSNNPNIKLNVMDCEKTSYAKESFDIIFDFGTFSSIDIKLAIHEILRILKPGGVLVCLETLGHNPIGNLNRMINGIRGKRTKWAVNHIMTVRQWNYISSFFNSYKIEYFNLFPLFFIPIIGLLPNNVSQTLLKFFWRIDSILLKSPIMQRYAFKTVVVLEK